MIHLSKSEASKYFVICRSCGKAENRAGPGQKYCRECSVQRDLERKRLWARRNPARPEVRKPRQKERDQRLRVFARLKSKDYAKSISNPVPLVDLEWTIRVAVAFSYSFSKNHIWSTTRNGHVYLREEHRAARHSLAQVIRRSLEQSTITVVQNKLWIDIFVQKSDHKGDAINVLDGVCDAIKEATGLDDRWYSVRSIDWEIVKSEPKLFVSIGQDSSEPVQACSLCGSLKPFHDFGKNVSNRNGIGRICRDCGVLPG
jgi:hypothetical protein